MRWLDDLTAARPNDIYGVCVLKDAPAALAAPVESYKPSIDRGAMAVTSILTTSTPDRQGDVIDPTGGDFSEHVTNPVVMFHHGKQHKLPIGKSEDRDGNYTVRLVKAQEGDVLIGTTHFAQSNRFANDVFGLVAEDILRGVSIGFDPLADEGSIEELGASPVLKRPALHFKGWKLLEYSHTPLGVNRDALTQIVHKALDGSRKLHPQLLAMLQPHAAPRKTTVAVTAPAVRKAMPSPAAAPVVGDDDEDDTDPNAMGDGDADDMNDEPGADGGDDPAAGADAGFDPTSDDPSSDPALADTGAAYAAPGDDEPPPTVQALTDGAQGLLDLCAMIEQSMKKSEHPKGRKFGAKLCADLRKTAGEAQQFAERISSELTGGIDAAPDDGTDPDAEENDNASTPPGDDGDDGNPIEPETDEEGALVTKGYAYAPRRFTYADLAAAAPVVQQITGANPQQLKALQNENAKLKRTLENLLTDMEAADRRNR